MFVILFWTDKHTTTEENSIFRGRRSNEKENLYQRHYFFLTNLLNYWGIYA